MLCDLSKWHSGEFDNVSISAPRRYTPLARSNCVKWHFSDTSSLHHPGTESDTWNGQLFFLCWHLHILAVQNIHSSQFKAKNLFKMGILAARLFCDLDTFHQQLTTHWIRRYVFLILRYWNQSSGWWRYQLNTNVAMNSLDLVQVK